MSALSSKFSILVVPFAKAANKRALFDKDLLPGSVIFDRKSSERNSKFVVMYIPPQKFEILDSKLVFPTSYAN